MRFTMLAAAVAPLVLSACTGSRLVYVHEQTVGLDLSITGEGTNKFNIGYDRETYALVPRVTPTEAGEEAEAMTMTAISRSYIQGLSNIEIAHCIATGKPAIAIAKGASELHEVAEKVFGGSNGNGGD